MPREFDINILMSLSQDQKYATTVAGFEIIDMNDYIDIPKKLHKSKPAVRAMSILDMEIVKWSYIGEEERQSLREELGLNVPQELEGTLTELKPAAAALVEKEKSSDKADKAGKEKSSPQETKSKKEKA